MFRGLMCIHHQRGSVELQLKREDTEVERDVLLCPSWEVQEKPVGSRPPRVCSQHLRSGLEGWKGCVMEKSSGFKELESSS